MAGQGRYPVYNIKLLTRFLLRDPKVAHLQQSRVHMLMA